MMKVSKHEGSTEKEENYPSGKYSAIVRAAWNESRKDFKTGFWLPVEAVIINCSLNAPCLNQPLPLPKP